MRNKHKFISIGLIFVIMGIANISFSSPFDIYYNQGKVFFEAKDYQKSYSAFLTAFQLSPGNWEVDFLLGRSAFEVGNYEMAIMAFERALITNPGMVRIKLEMARAYQKLGSNDMARKYCNEVLQTDPPDVVVKNINLFLSYIDKTEQRHFLKSSVVVGFDWTDNAWTTPVNSVINTTLGEVTLTGNSAQKKEDWIRSLSAQLNHKYRFPYQNINWTNSVVASRVDYIQEDELDMFYLGFESGLQFSTKNDMFGASLLTNLIEIDGQRYQNSYGLKAYYQYQFSPSFLVSPTIQAKIKKYDSNSNKDAENFLFKVDTSYSVKKNTWLNMQIGIENENADDDEYSYQKYSTQFSFNHDIYWDVNLFGSYNFSISNYEDTPALFSEAREDLIHQFGVGFKKKFWESTNKQRAITLFIAYQYTQSESNIELYEYQKNQIQSFLDYQF